ncbi:MAG: hypothetical protein PHT27_06145 [Candidatus Izemoplasmatales bacterium]|nr:hypothetical protein [Candidatus Izemoplasmatales bacterium]
MKKLLILVSCFIATLIICFYISASPVMAEEEITTVLTETSEEPITEEDIGIEITDDSVIISGLPGGAPDIVLSKDQAVNFLSQIIEENFGTELTAFGLSAGAVALIIVTLLCFALKYLVLYVKGQRATLTASQSKAASDDNATTVLRENTARTLRAEKRAIKAEAYGAIAAKGVLSLLANSSIEQNAVVGTSYQKELEIVNKLDDDVSEAEIKTAVAKIIKEVTDQTRNAVIGTTVKAIKAKRSALIAAIQNADGK